MLFNFSNPHNRAFHTSWWGFFSSFFSMFAAAPLMAYMKKASSLNLSKKQIGQGNIAAVSTNIVMRAITGFICDILGPRKALSFLLFITCPAIVGMMFVEDANSWIACRALIGIGLATFVTSQVWCTQMFNKSVVGLANATSAGWGNLGGGVTNLLMPYFFLAFYGTVSGTSLEKEDKAWRLCYLVPLAMHLIGAVAALTGRDLPDGNIKELEASGAKQKSNGSIVLKTGLSNVNAWILTITYALCFGVELTMTNVATQYFYEYHALRQTTAATLGSIFGLVNICARSMGGICSDWANKKFGMRGRIWALWIWQTIEGFLCIVMGLLSLSGSAPDFTAPRDVIGDVNIGGTWYPFNGTGITQRIVPCGSLQVELTDAMKANLDPAFGSVDTVVLSQAPVGTGADCVSNMGRGVVVVLVMFMFSVSVQMAEGLTFGIVPYVSRPALGVVSGMVGAGGNAGALVTNAAFFLSNDVRTDTGFINMGILIILGTLTLFGVYFPEMGGMLFKPGSIKYDPQCIKPPQGYKGSDEITIKADSPKEKSTATSTTSSAV